MCAKIPVPPLGADAVTADDFQVYSAPSLVRFLSRGVQPPSQIYLKHTDTLQVACASSQAGESVTFNYRLLRADGSLVKGQFVIQVPATRAVVTQNEPMAEGFLLSLSCKAAVAKTRGQTFARAFLTAGSFGPNQPSYTLMADYVTTAFAPAHPNGRVLAPSEGPGNIITVVGSVPGLGAPAILTVPTNARWRPKIVTGSITTDAVAGNRQVEIDLTINGTIVLCGMAEVNVAPGTTSTMICHAVRMVPVRAPVVQWLALPEGLIMLGADLIEFSANGFDVGDRFTAITATVEEWLDNV